MPDLFAQGRAVVIGVANYLRVSKLPANVLDDVYDFGDLLKSPVGCGYPPENVEILADRQASAEGIRAALRRFAENTTRDDTAVVFFSGHGARVEEAASSSAYLLPFDCDPLRLSQTAIGGEELTDLLSAVSANRLVVLLDACHSAGAGELKALVPTPDLRAGLNEKTYRALAQGTGRVIMASSRLTEVSLVLRGMRNSLFTHHLLDGLRGAASTRGDGLIRVFDVFQYVSDKVSAQAAQHPIFKAQDLENNFPMALHPGGKQSFSATSGPPLAVRPQSLSGKARIEVRKRLVSRWTDLALYFEVPLADRSGFGHGADAAGRLLDWLEERKQLPLLRDAFNYLGWDDLIEVLDRPPLLARSSPVVSGAMGSGEEEAGGAASAQTHSAAISLEYSDIDQSEHLARPSATCLFGQVFISHVDEDGGLAATIAKEVYLAGFTTSHFGRDHYTEPQTRETKAAIAACEAMVVIVPRGGVKSQQMSQEISYAEELKKPFVPVFWALSAGELQSLRPEWRAAFETADWFLAPPDSPGKIAQAIIQRAKALGLKPGGGAGPDQVPAGTQPTLATVPEPTAPAKPRAHIQLTARFNRTSYPPREDSLVFWLAELHVEPDIENAEQAFNEARLGADAALVLDVSGSMDKPNRYPLLREAVRRLVLGLGSPDRLCVILFTHRAMTVIPFMDGGKAADDPDQVAKAMDKSGILFGDQTLLAPGLRLALEAFGPVAASTGRARRMYVLTDGELHDSPECEVALRGFRSQSIEVHVYGFGDEFNAAALKRLVSDQIGGTVKPIVNEEHITRTFAHVSEVNRRLVGHNGKLTVDFPPDVVCGDAWVYQPYSRYLGQIEQRRVEHVFGGIEAGRRYCLLVEARLPNTDGLAGSVEAAWIAGDQPETQRIEVTAPRSPELGSIIPDVQRAVDILQVLRAANDKEAQLASYKARRELAVLENRDPELIAALDKLIAGLANSAVQPQPQTDGVEIWRPFKPSEALTQRERQIVDSDTISVTFSPSHDENLKKLLAAINELLHSGVSAPEVIDGAIPLLAKHVQRGFDFVRARGLLEELSRHLGLSSAAAIECVDRLKGSL
jgi:Mg-chelatase subunit ChlD